MLSARARFIPLLLSALAASALLASCAQTRVPASSSDAPPTRTTDTMAVRLGAEETVRPGIEVFLTDVPPALRGKRVGLITNHTGIDRLRTPDIDLIAQHDDLQLVALLAPEHGIRGTAEAGVTVNDDVDEQTGVPIYSL